MVKVNKDSIEGHDYNRARSECDSSNWQHEIYLSEDGVVDVYTVYGSGTPGTVWHNRDIVLCSVPDGTAIVAPLVEEIEGLLPLLQEIHDGHTVAWNGSNHVGRWDEEIQDKLETVWEQLRFYLHSESLPWYYDASEWLTGNGVDQTLIDQAGLADADRDALIQGWVRDAEADGVYLDPYEMDTALDDIRDEYCSTCHEEHSYCDCAD